MTENYRWVVTVRGDNHYGCAPYKRETLTEGPRPQDAARQVLERIDGEDNDLWQQGTLNIEVERVR